MKIIITEEQNDKLTRRVKTLINKLGLRGAIKMLGGNTNIIKHAYENNPLEFMDNFKDLESEERSNTISYRKNGKPIMLQNDETMVFWFSYDDIWSFYEDILNVEYEEIQRILRKWIKETLNLEGYIPLNGKKILYLQSWKRP